MIKTCSVRSGNTITTWGTLVRLSRINRNNGIMSVIKTYLLETHNIICTESIKTFQIKMLSRKKKKKKVQYLPQSLTSDFLSQWEHSWLAKLNHEHSITYAILFSLLLPFSLWRCYFFFLEWFLLPSPYNYMSLPVFSTPNSNSNTSSS